MVTCQSANQLKTPAKVSWDFKMVSQFGSLGYTITGKTADLTVVQKTIIDTLHKEGKPQTFIAKEADCSQSAVSKHVNRKLTGFGTCPHCQKHQKLVKCPWCWCAWLASKLTRPETNSLNLWGIVKMKMRNKRPKKCRWAEGHCQKNLGFHTTSAVPQTDHLHAMPNWGSN